MTKVKKKFNFFFYFVEWAANYFQICSSVEKTKYIYGVYVYVSTLSAHINVPIV